MVLKAAGDIPVEFHAHCNSGQAPLNYLEGVKLGMRILHTAIPPLANGSSQPSVFNIANNLKALGYDPQVDLKPLEPVVKHFTAVAQTRRPAHRQTDGIRRRRCTSTKCPAA